MAAFLDERKIRLHSPVVRPFVIHKLIKLLARIVAAKATKIDVPFLRAPPELALAYIIIDICAAAAAAVCCTTGTAIKTTGTVL